MKTLNYLLPFLISLPLLPHLISETGVPAAPANVYAGKVEKNFFRLGDQLMVIETFEPVTPAAYVLVGLHSNETAALETASAFARQNQVGFIRLRNGNKKHVEAVFMDQEIRFDPQHIFTINGRRKHLKSNKCWNYLVNGHVFRFSLLLLGELRSQGAIVSLHAEAGRRIDEHAPGGKQAKLTEKFFRNAALSPENFFLTNDPKLYEALSKKEFNVVLTDEKRLKDDGSLQVYCNKTKRSFLHIQVAAQDRAAQWQMLEAADAVLK